MLSGANYGPWVPPFVSFLDPLPNLPGLGIGHFVGAMRVDGFRPVDEFKSHMDNWIERFKSAKPIDANQPLVIPGEPELEAEAERKIHGIPLVNSVVKDLNEMAKTLRIDGI